MQVIDLIVH